MRRMAKASVTKATMLMRWPQRVQRSGFTWWTFAISLAQLGEHRLRGGSADSGLVSASSR